MQQVNGHIAPFLFDSVAPCSSAVRLQRYIVADVRGRLDKYAKASYLPTELNNLVAQEYAGKPEDVTIFPRLRLSDLTCASCAAEPFSLLVGGIVCCAVERLHAAFTTPPRMHMRTTSLSFNVCPSLSSRSIAGRILRHPTVEAMHGFIERGCRMTWPHLTRISYQTMVERSLQRVALKVGVDVFTPKLSLHEHGRAPHRPPVPRDELHTTPHKPGPGVRVGDRRSGNRRNSGHLLLPQITWPPASMTSAFGVDFAQLIANMGFGNFVQSGRPSEGPPPPSSSGRKRGTRTAPRFGARSTASGSPSGRRGGKKHE